MSKHKGKHTLVDKAADVLIDHARKGNNMTINILESEDKEHVEAMVLTLTDLSVESLTRASELFYALAKESTFKKKKKEAKK
jgi:hypothetical protein